MVDVAKFHDQVFQLMAGAGMGLVHSGALSDLAFFVRCEVCLGRHLCMFCYLRFGDDLLVVAKSSGQARVSSTNCVSELSGAGECWSTEGLDTSTVVCSTLFLK